MNEKREMQNLLNRSLSGLQEDPFLARRVIAQGKEEPEMKKLSVSMILVIVLLCIIISALAANSIFGWVDFFKTKEGTRVPAAAQEIMKDSGGQTRMAGPVEFTVYEMYSDKNIAMVSTKVSLAEGEKGLVCMDPDGAIGANGGENGKAAAARLGITDPMVTWAEAANRMNLPLYIAEVSLEVPEEYYGSEEMGDPLFNEDSSMTLFAVQPLNGRIAEEELRCKLELYVRKEDPDAAGREEPICDEMELTIPVSPVTEACEYRIDREYVSNGMKLTSVRAELTPSGLYLYADFIAEEGTKNKGQYIPVWYNADGKEYDWGMTETYDTDTGDWPVIHTFGAIPEDKIPDILILSLEDDNAPEGSEPALRVELKK